MFSRQLGQICLQICFFRLQVCHMRRSVPWMNRVIATAAEASTWLGAWHSDTCWMLQSLNKYSGIGKQILSMYYIGNWQSTCLIVHMFMLMSEFNFRLAHQLQHFTLTSQVSSTPLRSRFMQMLSSPRNGSEKSSGKTSQLITRDYGWYGNVVIWY